MRSNWKSLCLFLSFNLLMSMAKVTAQSTPAINHIALYVFDLKKSADFYKNVMQLKEVPEPFRDGKHVWLQIGTNTYLHLIEGAKEITEHDINSHLAFRVEDLNRFIVHIDKKNVNYRNWQGAPKATTVRTDGVKQIYLQDPDNYWIEVNDEK
jgi:lactoylglutathione lyase